MSNNLSILQVTLLCLYAMGMAGGQILFKFASFGLVREASLIVRLLNVLQNPYFIAAVTLYFLLTVFWVWFLSFTPLSRAYPFLALAFGMVPIVASFVFAEPLGFRPLVGILFVLGGLILVAI